jgi:hypothetical protein
MAAAAKLAVDVNGHSTPYTYGMTPNNPKTWDAQKIYGCICDEDYMGYDCSQKICPYGYDPDKLTEKFEVQSIYCKATSGKFWLSFKSQRTASLAYTASASDITTALEALSNIDKVRVSSMTQNKDVACTSSGNTMRVTFISDDHNIPLMNVTSSSITSIYVTEYSKGTKELLECSGRGICDRSLGTCTCFAGYGSSDGQGNVGNTGDCGYLEPESQTAQL